MVQKKDSSPKRQKTGLVVDGPSTGGLGPAASGASPPVASQVPSGLSPGPLSITQLLEMNTKIGRSTDAFVAVWAQQMKEYVNPEIMPFLKVNAAHSIRFAMHHQHMNGSRTWDAEASVRVIQHSIESSWRDLWF